MSESFTSVGESVASQSEKGGRKRKGGTDLELKAVLVDAVQSIGQMSSAVINSRNNEKIDDFDDDWLFAKSVYIKLKDVPTREAKERFKMKVQSELMDLIFDDQSKHSNGKQLQAMSSATSSAQRPGSLRPIILYRNSQAGGPSNPPLLAGSQIPIKNPVQMYASVSSVGNNVQTRTD